MKLLTTSYKIANVAFGVLIALYFAFLAMRALVQHLYLVAVALAVCSVLGYFIYKIALKEYKLYKSQEKDGAK